MASAFAVECALPDEVVPALRLVLQYLTDDDREWRVRHVLNLIEEGEFDPAGIRVVRGPRGPIGAMIALAVPGAGALVWPPQAMGGAVGQEIEDCLIGDALAWLRRRGAKLAQTLLIPEDAFLAAPLERNGFVHITQLWYLRHVLDLPLSVLCGRDRLAYRPYRGDDRVLFQETLLRTYEGTADCPELSGVRDVGEIIEGHRAQGVHDPEQWWLAVERDWPVGVLMTTVLPETGGWEVSYVGVVPEARGRGVGRELMNKALLEARAAEAPMLTLTVDGRNRPAWNLYRDLGFESYDQREVYLAVWRDQIRLI